MRNEPTRPYWRTNPPGSEPGSKTLAVTNFTRFRTGFHVNTGSLWAVGAATVLWERVRWLVAGDDVTNLRTKLRKNTAAPRGVASPVAGRAQGPRTTDSDFLFKHHNVHGAPGRRSGPLAPVDFRKVETVRAVDPNLGKSENCPDGFYLRAHRALSTSLLSIWLL